MPLVRSEEWFTRIFDKHYNPLRNYLYYLSGDISWTDDAVQEVFMLLWEKRHDVQEDTLQPFLFKIGRNLFLKSKRREVVHLKFEKSVTDVPLVLSPEEEMSADEFDRQLQQTISELPEKCRAVFLMSRLDDMSQKQIADSLGVSLKAVEKQITKALKYIRGKLEKNK